LPTTTVELGALNDAVRPTPVAVVLAPDPAKVVTVPGAMPSVVVAEAGCVPVGVTDAVPAAGLLPTALAAVTLNVYATWFRRSLKVTSVVEAPAVIVSPPGLATIEYPVTGVPPFEVGAIHETVTAPLPATADADTGAVGAVAAKGVTAVDGAEARPTPMAFVAVTAKVYEVPFVRPVTTIDVAVLDAFAVIEPGVDVTV